MRGTASGPCSVVQGIATRLHNREPCISFGVSSLVVQSSFFMVNIVVRKPKFHVTNPNGMVLSFAISNLPIPSHLPGSIPNPRTASISGPGQVLPASSGHTGLRSTETAPHCATAVGTRDGGANWSSSQQEDATHTHTHTSSRATRARERIKSIH
jgi:hypothetical protein